MSDKLESILASSGIDGCVECGKCMAACPMSTMYPQFCWEMSPRGVIRRVMTGEDILDDPMIWYCTGCNAGSDVCPQGVSCRDLIQGLRQLALENGRASTAKTCDHCGAAFMPLPVGDYLQRCIGDLAGDYLSTCPACRQRRYALRNA